MQQTEYLVFLFSYQNISLFQQIAGRETVFPAMGVGASGMWPESAQPQKKAAKKRSFFHNIYSGNITSVNHYKTM